MIVAFTGPSSLTREQELVVTRYMNKLALDGERDTWRSGAAYGVDTVAARHAVLPNIGVLVVELYVPAAPHNDELVKELTGIATIIRCPVRAEPYRIRNKMMIDGLRKTRADVLVAFVKSDKFYRSGEWMTVNIAKAYGVQVDLNVI